MSGAIERVIDPADVSAEPWRNGLGTTRTLARGRGWRLSLATIEADSRFSVFDGVDRVIVPLGHDPLTLMIDGERRVVPARSMAAFRGERTTTAIHVTAPMRAINLMTDRHVVSARLVVVGSTQPLPADHDLLVVLDGTAWSAGRALRPGAVLLHPRADADVARAAALVACVSLADATDRPIAPTDDPRGARETGRGPRS